MRKFFKLFLLTAVAAFAMSVMTMAAEEISENTTLSEGNHTEIVIHGSADKEAPLEITVPENGITVKSAGSKDCITIADGYVKLTGGHIYHKNDTNASSASIIKVAKNASLTVADITIYGRGKDVEGIPSSSDKTQSLTYGIEVAEDAELNIEKGAEIAYINTDSAFVYGSTIFSTGTVNVNGGSIHSITVRGGAAIMAYSGSVNFNGGTVYDAGKALYNMRGIVTINGGLMTGALVGSYNISGEYNAGIIENATGGTVTDKTDSISVTAKEGANLVANPTHDIVTEIDGKEFTGMFYNGKWHFRRAEDEHIHEIHFNVDEINLSMREGQRTAELTAQIYCAAGHTTVASWETTGPITYKAKPGDSNTIIITATGSGTATVKATTSDTFSAECKINIAPVEDIHTPCTLENKTYTDLTIKGTYTGITVTVPQEGITVASTNSNNCVTITEGQVTLTGGPIYHKDGAGNVSTAIIRVERNATLTLDNVTIDGREGPDSSVSEKVMCGIHNEGYLYIKGGTVIKNINADDEIPGNAAVHNASKYSGNTFGLLGCAIYGNTGFAVAGSITAFNNNNIIVGKLDDAGKSSFVGQGYNLGVISGTIGETVKMGNYEATAKVGDTLVTNGTATVTSQLGNHTCVSSFSDNEWEFKAQIKGIASYVKGKNTQINTSATNYERFESSHVMNGETVENNPAATAENSSVSTAFIDDILKVEGEKAYLLFDVIVPSSPQNTYIRIGTNINFPNGLSKPSNSASYVAYDDKNTCIYKANSSGATYKYRLTADNTGDSTFGLIINKLYSTDAYAYIKACTADEYNNASDYEEVNVSGGTAAVSLD